jgi:hypothetical protein
MVGLIVMAMDLISNNVMIELVQLTEDGAVMANGVNVPNRVVVVLNQDVDLVLTLGLLMAAWNVMAMRSWKDSVMPM